MNLFDTAERDTMQRDALISRCGGYRYSLSRVWSDDESRRRVLWIMLNPSTADADIDDPTIRRCIAFSRQWGGSELTVVNLFAFRSTSPKGLFSAADPVGPNNDRHIAEAIEHHSRRQDYIVAAWGSNASHAKLVRRRDEVLGRLPVSETLCLKTVASGDPGHPLYVPSYACLNGYEFPASAWLRETP